MIKYAFFDVDGTLSSPCYMFDGKLAIATDDDKWAAYCKNMGEDGYKWCRPVPQVGDYAKRLKAQGATLFILTSSSSKEERASKWKFVNTHFPGLFDDIYTVEHDHEKCPIILEKAASLNAAPEECEIVEDTFRILFETAVAGIRSTHITTILTGLTEVL